MLGVGAFRYNAIKHPGLSATALCELREHARNESAQALPAMVRCGGGGGIRLDTFVFGGGTMDPFPCCIGSVRAAAEY